MTKEQFILFLKQPELLDQNSLSGLKEIIEDYPCFSVARMLYLRNLKNINSYRFETELAKHALYIPDRMMLFRMLIANANTEEEFQLLPFDETAFRNFFSAKSPDEQFDIEPPKSAIYKISSDETVAENINSDRESDLIDRFINENPSIVTKGLKSKKEKGNIAPAKGVIDDGLITETLAGIYVEQKLYDEALNAYNKLSLKFPEKNSYFACQIEKINKLILKDS